ncbi:zinc finger, CCHC-type containing protein [Tanacetum coccineum]
MDTLNLVSKYLNYMEEYLDDGAFLEASKLTVGKSKEELELFEALKHKSIVIKEGKHRVVMFTKAPPRTYSKPFTRFSLPCDVDGQGAWDAKLDMADSFNYMMEERFDKLGFVRVDYKKYGRKTVKQVRVEIHGFKFLVDFVVIGYANEGGLRKRRTLMLSLKGLVENVEEVGSFNVELVKIGKASRNKGYNVNKLTPPPQLKIEEIHPISSIAPPPLIYHPLSQKKKEKVKEALNRMYKELEESKPILLSSDEFSEEEKMRIVEHGLPKKICNPNNFVLPVKVNIMVEMSALADTRESVSVFLESLFKNLSLSDPRPYHFNLTMADNTQAKVMGKLRNRALTMEAYFNPFKNIIVFKKLVDFLGSLPIQLKNTDWGNKGYGVYKKIEDDGSWHAKFKVITPSGQNFTRGFKTKETKGKLSEKFTSEDILKFDHFLD